MNNAFFYGLNKPIYVTKNNPNPELKQKENHKPKSENLYPLNDKQLINFFEKKQISPEQIPSNLIEKLCLNLERRLGHTFKIMEKTLKITKKATDGHYLLLAVALTHPSNTISYIAEKNLSRYIKTKNHLETFQTFLELFMPYGNRLENKLKVIAQKLNIYFNPEIKQKIVKTKVA